MTALRTQLVVFDFDWSFAGQSDQNSSLSHSRSPLPTPTDQDTDRYVFEVLAPELRTSLRAAKTTAQWTDNV